MGHFQTDIIGKGTKVKFVDYSENKIISISPDIMKHDVINRDPKFDLIIGTKNMQELGIVLYISTNMIEEKMPNTSQFRGEISFDERQCFYYFGYEDKSQNLDYGIDYIINKKGELKEFHYDNSK